MMRATAPEQNGEHHMSSETPEPTTGPVDTPPSSGEFVDWEGAQLDPETVAEGNQLGRDIDPDDDDDNGGVQ
jgi:hypothetical protein